MAENSSILVKELYPTLDTNLKAKKNTSDLEQGISKYLDRNMESLTKIGPTKMILFTETDKELVFTSSGLNPKSIDDAVKKVELVWGSNVSKAVNIALALAIRHYKIEKNKTMADKCVIYLTMAMYPSLFYNFWKFDPNEDIMRYTINSISNKYKIKQEGSLYLALWDTASLSDKTYDKIITRGTDDDIRYYIQALNTRIRSLLRKIANEFYINEKEKNYMNDEYDDPNPDSYKESDSSAYAVERMTNSVMLRLMDGPDMKIIDLAARTCQVSRNELRNYINTMIKASNAAKIKTVVSSILYLYLYDEQNDVKDVRSNKFLIYCLETYKKSNTTDKNIVAIKKILDEWLEDLGTYKKSQRLATINNFRRALFTFFVFTIEENA